LIPGLSRLSSYYIKFGIVLSEANAWTDGWKNAVVDISSRGPIGDLEKVNVLIPATDKNFTG